MISSKELYSKGFEEYILSESDLRGLQSRLLSAFREIKLICDQNNIQYMLSGGSCLGAVRHKGFIPWDDDIDLMMRREDYERLSTILKEEYKDEYRICEPLDSGYYYKMPKIYIRGTEYVEVPFVGVNDKSEMFIDVFIIENAPQSRFVLNTRACIYDFCYKIASLILDYKYPSFIIIEKSRTNKEISDYYRFRRFVGCLFSHIGGMKFYLKVCVKLGKYNKSTGQVCVPSAISYKRELFPASVFDDTCNGEFCGMSVNLPKDTDSYLKNLYGNYMEIPPEDKRERHVAYKVKF